ncbi:MAG TPA: hypothetical protein VM695_06715 [Phycisphaerae bacterium]|nr:hypothetical protein [Phycisphaerae bacterium]
MSRQRTSHLVVALAAIFAVAGACPQVASAAEKYHSLYDAAFSPDGKLVAATDHTAGAVVLVDTAGNKVVRTVALNGKPTCVVWSPKGDRLYVSELGAGTVAEVDPAAGKVLRRLNVGARPAGLALSPKHNLLLATNMGLHCVSVVDLGSGKEKARVPMLNVPHGIAVTPDESLALVTNLYPFGDASKATQSGCLGVIDLKTLKKVADIKFTSGSTLMREVVCSPDGKWAYVSHTLGRFTLPTTQLDRGWVNTNAMTVVDLAKKEAYATVLLDRLTEGAADPWGLTIAKDGKTLWVTLSGVHQLGKMDLESLHLLMDGKDIPADKPTPDGTPRHLSQIWGEIKKDPNQRAQLANDLAALYGAGLLIRTRLDCNGPRGIDLAPDGKKLAIASFFTGDVVFADPDNGKVLASVPAGKQPEIDTVRRGEIAFHDARQCFQHWLSCATCHPEDARADGLNWDLLNDGIGNPKNTRSLLWSHKTPPVMSLGVRATYEVATLAGFRFILFREPDPVDVDAVQAYLRSREPDKSPHLLPDGGLSDKAKQGKKLFEDAKTGCTTCHPAPLLTDLKMYDVGTRGELDRKDAFDTPTLVELWRTGSYLHDGSAKTLQEVLIDRNKKDTHGTTSHLSKEQIDALVEYLLSL